MGRRPSSKPNKGTAPIAPPEGDIFGRMFVALVPENRPESDLDSFRRTLLPKFKVTFKDHGSFLVAAIFDPTRDKDHAYRLLRTEGRSERSNGIHRYVSICRHVPFIDPEDAAAIREQAYAQKTVTTVEKLRFHPREYLHGGLYIIWDEQERKCLYVGMTGKNDLAIRADEHFHLDNTSSTIFDWHCRNSHPGTASWKVYLIDPTWCDDIVRKSLFWDKEEYNLYMPHIEDEYHNWKTAQPRKFLLQAERTLIELYQSNFNHQSAILSRLRVLRDFADVDDREREGDVKTVLRTQDATFAVISSVP